MMDVFEDFVNKLEDNQHEVFLFLNDILTERYGFQAKLRYNIPFYYNKSWICYINPIKGKKIDFAFTRGSEISDIYPILNFRGRKQIKSIEFSQSTDHPILDLEEIIEAALVLDETVPYKSKRT